MIVEFYKTFDQNSSRKSKWLEFLKNFYQNSSRKSKWSWNSKRLSITIPVGKANGSGILKDFRSEFLSEEEKLILVSEKKTLINCEEKKISRTNLLSWRDQEFWHFGMKNLKYYYLIIPIYQILHNWVFHPF